MFFHNANSYVGAVVPKDISISASKGKGESEWVNNQTSLIAKNGGNIEVENKLTNTGAIIGSLNEDEKLKVSAKEIEVSHLEDKNKYENKGGGISVGFDKNTPKVPNISVAHDKIDKEQINRATAINTDFTISGETKKAEDLGFNTDLTKAQETTKDEEKHLNAELHTDLIDKEKRDEIVLAGRKIGTVIEAINNPNEGGRINTFKEGIVGIYFDEFRKENQKTFNLLKDEKISDNQKIQILANLQEAFYRKHGYEGELPELYLTDERSSFAVDSKNSKDGREKIFISIHHLNDPNSSITSLFGHETGHLNTYDTGEDTAEYLESKIGKDDLNKQFTESEREEYLKSLGIKYLPTMSKEEQFVLARSVPESEREEEAWGISKGISFMTPKGGAGLELLHTIVIDDNTGETYLAHVLGMSGGVASKFSAEIGGKFQYFPKINKPEDFDGGLSVSGNASIGLRFLPTDFTFGASYDVINKEFDTGFGGLVYSPKKFKNTIKNLPELKKIEFEIIGFDVSAEVSSGLLLAKEKISIKESEELFSLRKREIEIEEQLKTKNIDTNLKKNLETEKKIINQKTEELVKKIYEKRKVKIIHGNSDSWD